MKYLCIYPYIFFILFLFHNLIYVLVSNQYTTGNGTGSYASNQVPPAPFSCMDVDSETDSNHDTALTLACAGGHEELVELLLSRGADIGKYYNIVLMKGKKMLLLLILYFRTYMCTYMRRFTLTVPARGA